jgi:hypothetical protein
MFPCKRPTDVQQIRQKPLSGSIYKKSRDSLQMTSQIAPGKPVCDDNADRVFTPVLVYQGVQNYVWNIKIDTIRALPVLAEFGATKA